MSEWEIVTFNVKYGGYWVKNLAGDVGYIGGEVKTLEGKPEDLYVMLGTEFRHGLYGQSLWYKLPFEDHKDRKILGNEDPSFRRMCAAGRWTGVVNVFLVNTIEHPRDEEQEVAFDEDIRVERNVAGFVDEEEDFDYHNTPPNSDGEEEEEESFVRFRRGSGHLELRQLFDTVEEFKDALVEYALKEGRNIKLNKWEKLKSSAVCATEGGCPWRIYCSYEERLGKWMVKTYFEEHSCQKDGHSRILKAPVITKLFLDDIRTDPDMKPMAIQRQIEQRFNLITTIDKCKKAKAKAIDIINRDYEEQFSRLKDYRLAILESNPGSTVELDTVINDEGSEVFQRFYVCFATIRTLWSMWCRPIFGLDGCFMKSTLKGQLLAAVGRDANNGMYPIAWAVVDVENEDNWIWFISKLQQDFNLQAGQGYTVISDRQKGLLNAVERILPHVEHRMCARHIYGNLKKAFPSQHEMKNLFWAVAESCTTRQYEASLEAVQRYDMRLFAAIMEKNPKNCSLAFCSPKSSCVDVHNNISESFNNAIDPARYMPMVEMLETIRRSSMIRIDLRNKIAANTTSRYPSRVMEVIKYEQEKLKFCKIIPGGDGRWEVRESSVSHSVNLRLRTCACRRWDLSGIPCRHALRIIAEKKLNYEDYISAWFLNSRQQQIYSDSIRPVNGMCFWNKNGHLVIPPPSLVDQTESRKGRKPKPKRKKGKNESPTKKRKVSREKRTMHCGRCGVAGHNVTKCSNIGVPMHRPPRKRATRTSEDAQDTRNLDFGEGPSQATQD
ncbi:uncharacterized protein LOC125606422 [Brassica napus]|uniref:uncharacterized protein LOC125606422 n=1 Tax=Brassica napus TaxID=3708 RepID=UPI002078988D|nr:uncharacterized protein LOC125606422 [Brassica napus]